MVNVVFAEHCALQQVDKTLFMVNLEKKISSNLLQESVKVSVLILTYCIYMVNSMSPRIK